MEEPPWRGASEHDQVGARRLRCYRVCDRRFPFLWADASQQPGRWHGSGDGPCHYLSTTPKGAWAEVLRHHGIRQSDELFDLELSLWELDVPAPTATPDLDPTVLVGDGTSYPACRAEARRIRAAGHGSLRAPAAALISGAAELFGVLGGAQVVTRTTPSETVAIFGAPDALVGMPLSEGRPDPAVLDDVRHL